MTAAVRQIAAHDWRLLRREATAARVVVLVGGALVLAGAIGTGRLAEARATSAWLETREAAARRAVIEASSLEAPVDAVPEWGIRHADFVANDQGTYVVVPPPPLIALAVGQSDLQPSWFKVTMNRRESAASSSQIEHPLALLTGAFDLLFVVTYLLPLAIAAVAFDLTSGERERGTLRLLLAHPVRLRSVVAGKLVARAALVVTPVLLVPAIVAITGGIDIASLVRLAVWSAGVAAYGLFWFGLSTCLATTGRSSAANALRLGGAWLALVVVVPAAVGLGLSLRAEVPSGVAFADATRSATRDALSDGSRVLGHFLEDHPTASAVGRDGLRQYALLQAARDTEVERRLRPLLDDYERALAGQRTAAWWLQFLSPALSLHAVLTDAAGTSGDRHRHAVAQVERFRDGWRTFFEPLVLRVEHLDAASAAAMPAFVYEEESAATIARRASAPLAVMAALGMALLAIGTGRRAVSLEPT